MGGTNTGDSTYWTGLLYGLSRIQFDAKVVLFSSTPKPDIPWLSSFEWITIPARSSRLWSLISFPAAARRLGADVIHTQYSLSPLIKKGGITTIHDVSFFIGPDWFSAKDRILLQRLVPSSAARSARVLTVSESSKKEIEQFIPSARGKIVVTPNACPPWIQKVNRDIALARARELGFNGRFALTVGTRWPRKNMDLAVKAMDLVTVGCELAVTGKFGWGDSDLGGRGRATGYVSNEDLCALYSAADLYLAPSRHEGFGIPLLEAFRCGCPVMCSVGGALPEVAGDAALVESSWEPAAWANQISNLLEDGSKLESLRNRGFQREHLFSWEQTAEQTLRTYLEVANES